MCDEDGDRPAGVSAGAILKFKVASGQEIGAGQLRVELPYYVFFQRDKNDKNKDSDTGQGELTIGIPSKEQYLVAPSDSGLYYEVEKRETNTDRDDVIVITNGRDLQGGGTRDYTVTLTWWSMKAKDQGYDNSTYMIRGGEGDSGYRMEGINAVFAIRENDDTVNELTSCGDLSLAYHTKASLNEGRKSFRGIYDEWRSEWGEKPDSADDYFYIVWNWGHTLPSDTTQGFDVTFTEAPDHNGEVVSWASSADGQTLYHPVTPDAKTNTVVSSCMPSDGVLGGSNRTYYTGAVIRYPMDQHPANGGETTFNNTIKRTLNGWDGASDEETATASFEYSDVDFKYPPGNFDIQKGLDGSQLETAINRLLGTANIPATAVELSGTAGLIAEGGAYTLGEGMDPSQMESYGHTPYNVDFQDDFIALGNTRLGEGDYEFTSIDVSTLFSHREEHDLAFDSATQKYEFIKPVDWQDYSDISIEYTTVLDDPDSWKKLGTLTVDGAADQDHPIFVDEETGERKEYTSLPLPEGTLGIRLQYKTTHGRTRYLLSHGIQFGFRILPSDNVQSILADTSKIKLTNVDSLVVMGGSNGTTQLNPPEGGRGDGIYGTLRNPVIARDEALYGSGVNPMHGESYKYLERGQQRSGALKWTKGSVVNDTSKNRFEITYAIDAYDEATSTTFLDNIVQKSGVFYDLLPSGMYPDLESVSAWCLRGIRSSDYVSGDKIDINVRTVPNWRSTGRIMLIVEVHAPDDNNRYAQYSGFHLEFKAYYPWESVSDFGKNVKNELAYWSNDGLSAGVADDPGAEKNPQVDVDAFWDLDGDDNPEGTRGNVVYVNSTKALEGEFASETSDRKSVMDSRDSSWGEETETLQDGTYSYRLRVSTSQGKTKGIVIYDRIERPAPDHDDEPRWFGVLQSIDTSQPELKGIKPVIYYSTMPDLDLYDGVGTDEEDQGSDRDLSRSDIWNTVAPDDLSEVTAVAIDLSKKNDNTDYELSSGNALSVVLTMRAPADAKKVLEYQQQGARAINDCVVSLDRMPADDGDYEHKLLETEPVKVSIKASVTDFGFTKVDSADTSQALAGAEFKLFRWGGEGDAPEEWFDASSPAEGWSEVDSVTSGDDGRVTFDDVEAGTYRLIETKAPPGYVLPAGQWNVEVDPSQVTPEARVRISAVRGPNGEEPPAFATDGSGGLGDEGPVYKLPNMRPMDIPSSGGRGMAPYLILGAAVAAFGALAWMRRPHPAR